MKEAEKPRLWSLMRLDEKRAWREMIVWMQETVEVVSMDRPEH